MRCVTDVNLSDNTRLFFPGNDGFQPEDRDDTIAIVCQPRLCTQRIVTPRLSTVDVLDTATQQHTSHNSETALQRLQRFSQHNRLRTMLVATWRRGKRTASVTMFATRMAYADAASLDIQEANVGREQSW